jgi:hypothetical protein
MGKYVKNFESFISKRISFKNLPKEIKGDDLRLLLTRYGRDGLGKLSHEDVSNLIPWSLYYHLVEVPVDYFTFELDVDIDYKNISKFPPVVNYDPKSNDPYEVIDGKHRISMAKKRGDKSILVYFCDISPLYS